MLKTPNECPDSAILNDRLKDRYENLRTFFDAEAKRREVTLATLRAQSRCSHLFSSWWKEEDGWDQTYSTQHWICSKCGYNTESERE